MRQLIRAGLAFTVGALVIAASAQAPAEAKKKNNDVAVAVAAGVVGVAVGAALAEQHHPKVEVYYPGYRPNYSLGGYNPYFDRVFMPSDDVTCYPAQRACYNRNGSLASKWTRRIYGY